MENLYFRTSNNEFVILRLSENQKLIDFGSDYTIKTEGKLEEILLKTYFKDLKFNYLGELNKNFNFKKMNDEEVNSEDKLNKILSLQNISITGNSKYFIFKKTMVNR